MNSEFSSQEYSVYCNLDNNNIVKTVTVSEEAMNLIRKSQSSASDIADTRSTLSTAVNTLLNTDEIASTSSLTGNAVSSLVQKPIANDVSQPINITSSSDNAPNEDVRELYQVLREDRLCNQILRNYETDGKLSRTHRSKIVRTIIQNQINTHQTLNHKDFDKLSSILVHIFPSESKTVFYEPARRTVKESIPASGKLYHTYSHYLRELKKTKSVKEDKKNSSVLSTSSEVDATEDTQKVKWLEKNLEPDDTVRMYWSETTKLRLQILEDLKIQKYLERFPVLKTSLAPNLLADDFIFKFGPNEFSSNWTSIKPQLIKILLKETFSSADAIANQALLTLTEGDQQDIIILSLLPSIIRPTFVKAKRDHEGKVLLPRYKPSRAEVLNSMFLIVQSDTDIQAAVTERQTNVKTTYQPTALFVGHLGKLERYWITFDGVKFSFNSAEETLSNLFNFYYALDAEYPRESEQIWKLLQITCLKGNFQDNRNNGVDLISLLKQLQY
ncbi:uncharacterized protein LOC135845020 [Planococcus citri]|uniref:uncharacterized protein LOC135845020 n=1 Tax=Planococcus citri TaxID=170843 RepID=UPI0031F95CFA